MRVAVISAVYNEEKNITRLLDSLMKQARMPDEIILVDDGSRDRTAEIIADYARRSPLIKFLRQENRGPAAARNRGWQNSDADICVFTDGDCVPEPDWLERLLGPFADKEVGAAAGTYKTLNPENLLARFIGYEIAWRYRNVKGEVDAHGSYNLAVRRFILERVGGFKEDYPLPSGEDWDLTYKVSRIYKIMYVPEAVVGHYHPESVPAYLANQLRRAFDRMKLYKDHPQKISRDTYTGVVVKYQVLAAAALPPSLLLLYPAFLLSWLIPAALFGFLAGTSFIPFGYYWERDRKVAVFSVFIQFFRYFAWAAGMIHGIKEFGLP